MYKLETVNNSNFNFIDEFNITAEYKEELLEICTNKNIFKKLLLGKNIKFIKSGKNYIGFLWFSKLNHQGYKIYCIKILSDYNSSIYYEELFKFFNSYSSIVIGDNNNLKKDILLNMRFHVARTIIEMKRSIAQSNIIDDIEGNMSFRVFIDGIDERKRCNIQNQIFNSLNRQAIDEDDIQYEKYQNHYIPEGCIFINKDGVDIGYGQLIKKESKIYIVNFGILPSYRGLGHGKTLLKHLLKISEGFNISDIYLKCDEENRDALNLYKSQEFQIVATYHEYQRNEISY